MKQFLIFVVVIGLTCMVGMNGLAWGQGEKIAPVRKDMDYFARSFIKLAFNLGKYDPDYVDAYFGPSELKKEAEAAPQNLTQIKATSALLLEELGKMELPTTDEEIRSRHRNLMLMLSSLQSRVTFLEGETMTFDEESQAIYDAVSPSFPREHYTSILKELETLLPGTGTLDERYNAFKKQYIIPTDKVSVVFNAAIAEGRRRTKAHITLVETESFDLEYVRDKPWGAYNWFKGDGHSLIQVNTDLPIYVDRAVDLACHEGYPGHHVYASLIEQKLYKEKGWIECSIYPLFSPLSLLFEGAANFGIGVVFPGQERLKFEKEVIFPLAGLDPASADRYYRVLDLAARLSFAGNETARLFLDGEISVTTAVDQFTTILLMSKKRAEKYLDFVKRYRSYIINYNLGEQMVREYIEKRGGTENQPEKRWQEFQKLMASPLMPGDLVK